MAKRIRKVQSEEISRIKDWCELIANFILGRDENNRVQLNEFLGVISLAYERRNLKGLKMIRSDFEEWANRLQKNELIELNKQLFDKFGEDLIDNEAKRQRKIRLLLKKREINSEEEYRLVQNRIENIYAEEGNEEEVKALDKLLSSYVYTG